MKNKKTEKYLEGKEENNLFKQKDGKEQGAWEQLKDGMNEVEKWRQEPFLRLREQTNRGQPA